MTARQKGTAEEGRALSAYVKLVRATTSLNDRSPNSLERRDA